MKKILLGIIPVIIAVFLVGLTSTKALAVQTENIHNYVPCNSTPKDSNNHDGYDVDVTYHISNDPDSSVAGPNWALDTFDRHIQIWHDRNVYCAKATDSGSFTTTGPKSPQNGDPLSAGITGAISGQVTFTTDDRTHLRHTDKHDKIKDVNCTEGVDCDGLTGKWISYYFSPAPSDYTWSWTYTTSCNGTWTNAGSGNSGDITDVVDPSCSNSNPVATPSANTNNDNGGGWSPTPSGQNSTTNAPGAPSCTIPFPAPILTGGKRVDATTVNYSWWKSLDGGVDFQAIVFGYDANSMNMGAMQIDKNVTSLDVTLLHTNQPVFAQIWAFKGGCAEISNTLEVK